MASVMSPRSPQLRQALISPLEYLPVTRFPLPDERMDQFQEVMLETKKERQVIQNQPYRTTPLIFPGAKPRPDLVNNKVSGKPTKPTVYRPLDEKSVVANLDANRAVVNRQINSPRPLYSQQNVAEAVYVQTGVNLQPPIVMQPSELPQFNPQKSPTFRVLMDIEGPGTLLPAPHIQQVAPPQKYAHSTAPNYHLNSVGMPTDRIAQSGSFRRLMMSLQE